MVKIDTFKVIKLLSSGNYFWITFILASFWVLLGFFAIIQHETTLFADFGEDLIAHT